MKSRVKKMLTIVLLVSFMACFAGPNKGASAVVDYDISTEKVDNGQPQVTENSDYVIAIVANDVKNLHSYSVKVSYDKSTLEFVSAVKSLSPMKPAFVESKGGQTLTFIVAPGEENVEIATALKGEDETVTVSGNGVLGYLQFKGIKNGDSKIEISEVKLLSVAGELDLITQIAETEVTTNED